MTVRSFRFPRAFLSTSREELSQVPLTIKNEKGEYTEVPPDLKGHLFIIAFAGTAASPRPKSSPRRARPENTVMPAADGHTALFDGDGMVYRLDFQKLSENNIQLGKGWLTSRLMKTPAFFADKITRESEKYKEFCFRDLGIGRFSILGICNQINTALTPVKIKEKYPHRLFATNDVNRPYEIDPVTLKIISPIGLLNSHTSEFETIWPEIGSIPGVFEFLFSSAHPATTFKSKNGVDKAEVFTCCSIKPSQNLIFRETQDTSIVEEGKLFLIRWSTTSNKGEELNRWELKKKSSSEESEYKSIQISQSTHMLGVTENYIILADTAMKTEQIESFFLIIVEILSTIFNPLDLEKLEYKANIERLEDSFSSLSKMIRAYDASPDDVINPLSKFIDEQLKKVPFVSLFLRKPIHMTLSLIKQNLSKIQGDMSEMASLRSNKVSSDSFLSKAPLKTKSIKDGQFSLDYMLRSISYAVIQKMKRIKKNFLYRLINRLRVQVASRQNKNTQLYIVRREDLNNSISLNTQEVIAQHVEIEGAFVHFITDYKETEEGEIVIIAPMTDALDPAEYIVKYDLPHLSRESIEDISGAIPIGLDSNALALIKILPSQSHNKSASYTKYELDFEKTKISQRYRDKLIYKEYRQDPLYIGLYSFRVEKDIVVDFYTIEGGAFPELMTDFMVDLYKDYSPQRRASVRQIIRQVSDGIPTILTHTKVDRENESNPLEVYQTYVFEPGLLVFSIQFIPSADVDKQEKGYGYLACSVVRSDLLYSNDCNSEDAYWSDNSEIWLFDTQDLSKGSICKLSHSNLNFGLTLHSTWLSEIASVTSNQYSFEQDYAPLIEEFIHGFTKHGEPFDKGLLEDLFRDVGQAFSSYQNAE